MKNHWYRLLIVVHMNLFNLKCWTFFESEKPENVNNDIKSELNYYDWRKIWKYCQWKEVSPEWNMYHLICYSSIWTHILALCYCLSSPAYCGHFDSLCIESLLFGNIWINTTWMHYIYCICSLFDQFIHLEWFRNAPTSVFLDIVRCRWVSFPFYKQQKTFCIFPLGNKNFLFAFLEIVCSPQCLKNICVQLMNEWNETRWYFKSEQRDNMFFFSK